MFLMFISEGYIKLFMENSRIKVEISSNDVPKVLIDNFDQTFNDGNWHEVELSMQKNKAVLADDNVSFQNRKLKSSIGFSFSQVRMLNHNIIEIRTRAHYSIGGGLYGHTSFIGCMRRIVIDGQCKASTAT